MARPMNNRRPAGDLIEAIVRNMRDNCETLRYSTVVPSRYTVYLSAAEYTRLEGLLPRLRAEAVRALDEELSRSNRRAGRRRRWFGRVPAVENAGEQWHVDFLPDLDGDLGNEQDIIVHSELILPAVPELGTGSRTRRVTTVHSERHTSRAQVVESSGTAPTALARLEYQDRRGQHSYDIVRPSTTIGRGGTVFPVDVRVQATDDVSREHARIRRDDPSGTLFLIDLSTHGTTIDGRAVPRGFEDLDGRKRENGVETALPSRAKIGLANAVFIDFQRL